MEAPARVIQGVLEKQAVDEVEKEE